MAIRYILEIGDPVTHRFSTAVRNAINPSDATYPDEFGDSILYPVKLEIPTVNNKISDAISGASKLVQYNLEIQNSDGKYDDVKTLGWFNTPVTLKRSDAVDPLLSDFNTIMIGEISYPIVSESSVKLVINNAFRSFTQEVTNTFNITDYPNVIDNVLDKNIPIGYGELLNVPLYQVDTNEYIALDKEYISTVTTVYDSDGVSISFSFDILTGQITATDAVSADVTGRTTNKIGTIITTEIQEKALITYDSTNWDTTETNSFILNDMYVNFYFAGGTVRALIDKVLKNDNAFLFTKNSGLLTLRQWGRVYSSHFIKDWQLMKFPRLNFEEAQRYFISSVILDYQKDISENEYQNQLLTNNDYLFDKTTRKTYSVDLYSDEDLDNLATRLLLRFSELSEVMSLYSGASAESINLLDLVFVDLNINGRQFSKKTSWIVRECDPAQDILVLESTLSAEELGIIDGELSQVLTEGFDGNLSQPMYNGIDGVLSQPLSVTA